MASTTPSQRSKPAAGAHETEITPPVELVHAIESYLAQHPTAAVLEEGRILFDMRTARSSCAESHGRCLLEIWSEERNLVRTVTSVQERSSCLRLETRRMGVNRPQSLELVPTADRRTPTTRDRARRNYQRLLERVLSRQFPDTSVEGFRAAMDLEHSFGPAYVRGHLRRGTAVDAVIGVSAAESTATIDGVLTLGILWLDYCRQHAGPRRHFGGLKVVVPVGAWRTTAERIAWLNHAIGRFELYTLDDRNEELVAVDFRDTGNYDAHLVHAFSPTGVIERCQNGIQRLLGLVPEGGRSRVEVCPHSAAEVVLLLHGLEFARVRNGASAHSFARETELTFGAGSGETLLTDETEPLARELFAQLFRSRNASGHHTDPLFRLAPERWLESQLRTHLSELLPGLRGENIYSQVPALSSGDRGMLDLLALDRNGRLAVLELKAGEDLHLPMQALDYWIRVRALHADRQPLSPGATPVSAFTRHGYFPGVELSQAPPRLILAAPALRIHPANEVVLRYLSPEVQWEMIALAEQWRHELKIVFRKRGAEPR